MVFTFAELSSRHPKSAGEAVYVSHASSQPWLSALAGSGDRYRTKSRWATYLQRFANEQTVTKNTAAIGGNASLLAKDLD